MFNPLYTEIYQAASFILAVAAVLYSVYRIKEVRKENLRLQEALRNAWVKARLEQLQKEKQDYPEDWDLRGIPADFEGSVNGVHPVYRAKVATSLRLLSNEQLADCILSTITDRLSYPSADDKVFTRLAGRIFRAVEKERRNRTQSSITISSN